MLTNTLKLHELSLNIFPKSETLRDGSVNV